MSEITITITVRPSPDEPDAHEYYTDFPRVWGESVDDDVGLNFAKGACLIALGNRKSVPDKIEFVVKRLDTARTK